MKGIFRILEYSYGWAVCKLVEDGHGQRHWRKISTTYYYYGWALNFARRHYITLS